MSLKLDAVVRIGDVAGRTWVVAMGPERQALLLHLDSVGGLRQTPLPWWSERAAIEGGERPGLRFIDTAKSRWFRVDLGDPRRPEVGPVRPISGLKPGQYPKAVASDGRRALVSLYRRAAGQSEPRYLGETFLLDAVTGAGIGPPVPATLWMARCARGRCFGLAELNRAPQPTALVEVADGGLRELEVLGAWGCSGAVDWREGDDWWIARSERGRVALSVLDLQNGEIRRQSIEVGDECSEPQHIALEEGHGLILNGRQLIRVGATFEGANSGPMPVPVPLYAERQVVRAEGWILVADFESVSWMQHDPPDANGEYEYTQYFSFKGQAGLLEREGLGWRWKSRQELPHSGEEGSFGDGYRPIVMSAPGQAGVLLTGDMGPSEYISLVEPC